jgi:hypothetical protein
LPIHFSLANHNAMQKFNYLRGWNSYCYLYIKEANLKKEVKTMEFEEQIRAIIEEEDIREQILLDAFWDSLLMESSELTGG